MEFPPDRRCRFPRFNEWYARHCDRDWRKWSIAEAIEIFEKVGLVGPFWSLESREGSF
jgi:hypothetical protein